MPGLSITASDPHRYDVKLTADDGTRTQHCVQVSEELMAALGLSAAQEPLLVRASLTYLLQREPASTIPAEFTLDDLDRMYADYRSDIIELV